MKLTINVFPNKDKKGKQPDYSISAKIGEKWTRVGGLWKKTGKNGTFLSGEIDTDRQVNPSTPKESDFVDFGE